MGRNKRYLAWYGHAEGSKEEKFPKNDLYGSPWSSGEEVVTDVTNVNSATEYGELAEGD